jgi:methylphosphotriester-DNA--protein-cysteine methyltransferase
MTTYPDDDARWDAMRSKDRAAEGAFYIAVRAHHPTDPRAPLVRWVWP